MSTQSFHIKIFTPLGLVVDEVASELKLPTAVGEIGVLPMHARYTGILGTGILEYRDNSGAVKRYVISGGFASFSESGITILADSIDSKESALDIEKLKGEKPALSKLLSDGNTASAEWMRAKERLARIESIESLLSR